MARLENDERILVKPSQAKGDNCSIILPVSDRLMN